MNKIVKCMFLILAFWSLCLSVQANETYSFPEADDDVSVTVQTASFMSVSSGLSVTSNIKLNGISVGENGMRIIDNANMICTLGVLNTSENDDSITAILVTYTDEGELYDIRTFKINVGAGQTNSMEIVYQFDASNEYSGKILIWNTLTNLIPIRASVDFTQTSGINAYYYNTDNRLLQIDKANGKSIYFTYDNMGNLLSRTTRK